MRGESDGFTIIEVMLFLAVTGMLLLMVFIGTGTMAARQRLTDTTDNLQAFLQTQYDSVVNGVNVRDTAAACAADGGSTIRPGASQNCLLIGKLIVIENSLTTLHTYYVISSQALPDSASGLNVSDTVKLKAVNLQATSLGTSTYDLRWGASFASASRSTSAPFGSGRGPVNAIAFLRIPDSSRIVQLYYNYNPADATGGLSWVLDPANNEVGGSGGAYNPLGTDTNPSLAICVKNTSDFPIPPGPRAAVYFGQGRGSSSITTSYEPGGLCP